MESEDHRVDALRYAKLKGGTLPLPIPGPWKEISAGAYAGTYAGIYLPVKENLHLNRIEKVQFRKKKAGIER